MAKTSHTPGSFCWFELATLDQSAAKSFYSSIFPWTVNDQPMGPDEYYTLFKIDGLDAAAGYSMRAEQRQQGVPPHWMPYILVKDADKAAARAKQLGGTVVADPFDVMDHGRMSVLQDPQGAMFCVWQPMKNTGTGVTAVDGTAVWADLSTPDQVGGGKFYGDLFGWKMVGGEDMRPAKPGDYFHIVNGKTMVGGVQPPQYRQPGVPAHWMLYFQVADCDRTVQQVSSLGGRVLVPTQTMGDVRKYAVLTDPQGATFAIVQSLGGASEKTEKPTTKTAKMKRPPVLAKKAAKKTAKKAAKKSAKKPGKKSKPAKKKTAKKTKKRR